MKIKEIRIIYKQHYFARFNGLNDARYRIELQQAKLEFLESNKNNIILIQDEEVHNLDYNSKPVENGKYSGYCLEYYQGWMNIKGKNISMEIALTETIMDLALKTAGGKIKELVKQEYREFEEQLIDMIDKTEQKSVFGSFVASKFKKLKQAILDNSTNQDYEN